MAKGSISARQERILEFIRDFLNDHHYPPTVRDIQTGCEVSSTSVVDYNLKILHREGYLRREAGVSRGIELTDGWRGASGPQVLEVPMLGYIAAGPPLPIFSDIRAYDDYETVEIPASFSNGKPDVFALRVKGTSMIDAFVADGDLVLLEPVAQPENGDMVAAWLPNEEVTLKRFYLQGDTVRLQPENETMAPIELPADQVAVRGRVVGVFRTV